MCMERFNNPNAEDGDPKVSLDIFANHRNPDGTVDWDAFIREGEARQSVFLDEIAGSNGEKLDGPDALAEKYGPFTELTEEDVDDVLYGSPDVSSWESFEQGPPQVEPDPPHPGVPPTPDA